MAGDWIKMRTDLYRDPKVCVMADQLMDEEGDLARYVSQLQMRDMTVTRNVMRNVTVGALVTVWGVTRHRGKRNGDDLIIHDVTLSVIDDIADLVGFGKAMNSVAWAIETDEGVIFPSFFTEFNVEPDNKAKKKNAERQRRYREKSNGKSNVTDNVTVTSRNALEKRESREEKSNNTHTHTDPQWREEWVLWVESWEGRCGKRFDQIQADVQLQQLGRLSPEKAKRDLQFSLEKYSKTILDSDNDFQKRQNSNQPAKKKINW